jgi:hypothetical protein
LAKRKTKYRKQETESPGKIEVAFSTFLQVCHVGTWPIQLAGTYFLYFGAY